MNLQRARYSALAVAVCAMGGWLCAALHVPLAWMIGPLVATAAGRICGLPLGAPHGGRQIGQIVIATSLGLYFTPDVARSVLTIGHFMLAGGLVAVGLGMLGAWILQRFTDTDWPTAYFASIPGGAAEMAVLGEVHGARVERIALSQSLRITLIVLCVPAAIIASGVHGSDLYQASGLSLAYTQIALLL